jgi:hypothetical protein
MTATVLPTLTARIDGQLIAIGSRLAIVQDDVNVLALPEPASRAFVRQTKADFSVGRVR